MSNITRAPAPIVAVFKSSSTIRIVMIDGDPWFVATDIAKALNFRNAPDMTRMLDDDEASTHIVRTPSKNQHGNFGTIEQEMTIINESGLYHAVLKSRKPEAKAFRKWVTGEVLPSIRKTGRYEVADRHEPEPERGITVEELQKLKLCARGISRYFPSISEEKALMAIYGRMKYEHRIRRIEQFPASRFGESITWLRSIEEKARAHWFAMQRYEAKVLADLGIPLNSY